MVLMCLLVVFIINANRSNNEYQEHVLSDLYHYYTSDGFMAAMNVQYEDSLAYSLWLDNVSNGADMSKPVDMEAFNE